MQAKKGLFVAAALFAAAALWLARASGETGPFQGFVDDIEAAARSDSDFRRVLYTGSRLQLVLMSLRPGEEIGDEVHHDGDQFFRVESGAGEIWIDGKRSELKAGMAALVPAGARHNVRNTGGAALQLYTLYGPPQHKDGAVQATKAEATASTEHFDGKTTE